MQQIILFSLIATIFIIVEIADWIACYVAVSVQNGLYLRS